MAINYSTEDGALGSATSEGGSFVNYSTDELSTALGAANIATLAKTAALAAQAAAETAETNAETSETNAATSETNAATSATNAAASEAGVTADANTATTKAAEAATSATNAATSETNAATSATNAATSATSAESSKTTATTKASEASTSATNAATSETNASTSETNASTSETNAATSATNASTSETNAATSETNASNSATNASTSASTATTKASEASTSATNAAASEVAAELAETNAETAETNAVTSATAAANSATAAATSETNIGNAETNSAASATAAATSETNAATSETNAATSATNASTSETNAATSETNASTSETNAATSATNASTSETNAATSETNAATSETNAATSETNAATSATTATTKATEASTSAANAATSATAAATSATAAATSATAAQTAETAAETAETNAETAQTAAEAAETAAEAAETSATASQAAAAASQASATASANSATASANSASSSATDAQSSEDDAATSEVNASNSAAAASSSASAASTSATNAATSASSATTSATTATTKASEASTSATNAATSETNAATSATAAATSETNAATSATTATTKASEAATSATSAAASLASFTGQYVSQATAPSSPTTGDLWFNETTNIMQVYNGTSWTNAGSSINGVENSVEHTATAGQTTFSVTYDVGYVEVYLNGIRLDRSDYTATNGTSVVLDVGAAVGDSVFIHAFGTFVLADHYTKVASDARYALGTQVLTNVPANAVFTDTVYTHPTGDGNLHVPATSTNNDGKILTAGSTAGSISWQDAPVSLPDQTGNNGKILSTDGSVASWIDNASSSAVKVTYEYTATAGQTTFSGVDNNGLTLAYISGNTLVTYGGFDLPFSDFTATNGTSVVLADGAEAGKIVRIIAFEVTSVANTYTQAETDASFLPKSGGTMTGGLTIQETALTGFSAYYGAGQLVLEDDNYSGLTIACDAVGSIYFGKTTDNDVGRIRYDMTYDNMGFTTAGIEQMRIGNGTTRIGSNLNSQTITEAVTGDSTTPRLIVEVQDDSATIGLLRKDTSISTDDTLGSIGFYGNDTTGYAIKPLAAIQAIATQNHNWASNGNGDSPTALRFFTTNNNSMTQTEKVRISDYGDLIVGKTSTASATSTPGTHLSGQYGGSTFTSTYNAPLTLSHTGNDNSGKELMFLYNGSTKIGEIGTHTDRPYLINPTYGGLRIDDYRVNPANTAGATWDNSVDLGAGGTRWKDLYLSGGVYLGGTGSANKLDDYEEGSWTPQLAFNLSSTGITYSTQYGTYVKIGSVVYLRYGIRLTSKGTATGNATINGLPFAIVSAGYADATGTCAGGGFSGLTGAKSAIGWNGNTRFSIYDAQSNGDYAVTNSNFGNGTYVFGVLMYDTAA